MSFGQNMSVFIGLVGASTPVQAAPFLASMQSSGYENIYSPQGCDFTTWRNDAVANANKKFTGRLDSLAGELRTNPGPENARAIFERGDVSVPQVVRAALHGVVDRNSAAVFLGSAAYAFKLLDSHEVVAANWDRILPALNRLLMPGDDRREAPEIRLSSEGCLKGIIAAISVYDALWKFTNYRIPSYVFPAEFFTEANRSFGNAQLEYRLRKYLDDNFREFIFVNVDEARSPMDERHYDDMIDHISKVENIDDKVSGLEVAVYLVRLREGKSHKAIDAPALLLEIDRQKGFAALSFIAASDPDLMTRLNALDYMITCDFTEEALTALTGLTGEWTSHGHILYAAGLFDRLGSGLELIVPRLMEITDGHLSQGELGQMAYDQNSAARYILGKYLTGMLSNVEVTVDEQGPAGEHPLSVARKSAINALR